MKKWIRKKMDHWDHVLGEHNGFLCEWHVEMNGFKFPKPKDPELRWYYEQEKKDFFREARRYERSEKCFKACDWFITKVLRIELKYTY